ncbi:MAG: hypothetical protein V1750_09990 [Acidobacteriota bacterium]
MKHGVSLALALISVVSSAAALAKDKAPYQWPAPPEPGAIEKAKAMKSESGLVIVERHCTIVLHSYDALPMGTTREELIRFLVVSEDGVRNASVEVNGDPEAKIAYVEGRTVAPDGTVTEVTEAHDINRVDVASFKKKIVTSLATVSFPAPAIGSLLDLHFQTTTEGPMISFVLPLGYSATPSLAMDFDVTIKGGFQGIGWAALTIGDTQGVTRLEYNGTGPLRVHVKPFKPARRLPFDPPAHQLEPTLLCYLDLTSVRVKDPAAGVAFQVAFDVNTRGRIVGVTFPSDSHREYWGKYLADDTKQNAEFLRRAGTAAALDVAAAAPADLPVEERVARLYRLAQEKMVYNPDAESISTLADMMRKGMRERWQGTLLLSYLLTRAGIPHQLGVVANRYEVRFSPVVRNEYLFSFEKVIMLAAETKELFLMPGILGLPFACLPVGYQDSVAFFPKSEKDVTYVFTPFNASGPDATTCRYDLELDTAGDLAGTMTVIETGIPSLPFFGWNLYREFRKAHPNKDDKKAGATGEKEKQADLDRAIGDEMEVPGNKLQLDEFRLVSSPRTSAQPLELSCKARGKGMAQPAQDTWLLYASPVLAGYVSPFTDERRRTPVWYYQSGHMITEGDITLPAGASVVELPPPVELGGPGGAKATCKVEQAEKDGRTIIRTRLELDHPLVVGTESYAAFRTFQAELVRLSQQRCIIRMPAGQELE